MHGLDHLDLSAVLAESVHSSLTLQLLVRSDLVEGSSTSIIGRPWLRGAKVCNLFLACRILGMLRGVLSDAEIVHLDFWRIRMIGGRMRCQGDLC
jgi:hypothetical protein